jgi:hypothetical protein
MLWVTRSALTIDTEIPTCPESRSTPCLRHEGPPGAPVVALAGDSIARSLDSTFLSLAREHQWTYVLAAANGCRLSHLLTADGGGQARSSNRECFETTPVLLDRLLRWNPTAIVAIDRWEVFDALDASGRLLKAGSTELAAATEVSLEDVARTLTSRDASLVLVELPPALAADCTRPDHAKSQHCRVPVRDDATHASYNAIVKRLAGRLNGVTTMSLTPAICPDGWCEPYVDGVLLRADGLHFTPEAVPRLAPVVFSVLTERGLLQRRR